jgi:thermitase
MNVEEHLHKPVARVGSLAALAISCALMIALVLQGFTGLNNVVLKASQGNEDLAATYAAIRQKHSSPQRATSTLEKGTPRETNRVIVQFKGASAPGMRVAAEHANLEKAHGLNRILNISGMNASVYTISEDDTPEEVVTRLRAEKNVAFAEIDMEVPFAYIPNDALIASAPHHALINTPVGWDVTKGAGVTIAIIDSGSVCTHEDLAANCLVGFNFLASSTDTTDTRGHGTAVTGAAAEVGDNGVGYAGVAFASKILPLRVSDDNGYATYSNIARAITYAADRGARVANASFGGTCGSATLQSATSYMRSKGGVVVFPAGNGGVDEGFTQNSTITCVSGTLPDDSVAPWSSFGQFVDIAAPATEVYTTSFGGGYGWGSGTSVASPLVAGTYALVFAANPSLTPAQADAIVLGSSDDLGTDGFDTKYGNGRLNVGRAVRAALDSATTTDSIPPTVPSGVTVSNIQSTSLILSWTASTDNVGVLGYKVYRNGVNVGQSTGATYTDTGLSAQTTYSYSVSALDAAGNTSAQSSATNGTTLQAPLTINTYNVSSKTPTSATIVATLSRTGALALKYGTSASALTASAVSNATGTAHTVTLTGLTPNTTYYYQLTASNGSTQTSSGISSFKTARQGKGAKAASR